MLSIYPKNNDLSDITGEYTYGTEVNIRSYNTSTGNLFTVPKDGIVHVYIGSSSTTADSFILRCFGHNATSYSDTNYSMAITLNRPNAIVPVKKGTKVGFQISGASSGTMKFIPYEYV